MGQERRGEEAQLVTGKGSGERRKWGEVARKGEEIPAKEIKRSRNRKGEERRGTAR